RAETLSELAAVFPSVGGAGTPAARQGGGDDRYRTHYAIRELLEWLSARQPTLGALGDGHWADAAPGEGMRPPPGPRRGPGRCGVWWRRARVLRCLRWYSTRRPAAAMAVGSS